MSPDEIVDKPCPFHLRTHHSGNRSRCAAAENPLWSLDLATATACTVFKSYGALAR
jgi:hypothetical protein